VTAPADILALRDQLKGWLFDDALPLWWKAGADHVSGGFFEKLTLDGAPVKAPRRTRVVARQIYVYAQAGRMGWTGPWRAAVDHGLAALLGPLSRPDGLFRFSVDEQGAPVDDSAQPYEQAFGLLALSAAAQALGEVRFEARALVAAEALADQLGRDDGGVHDDPSRGLPLRANPLMHLFEAALAWREAGSDPVWADLADRISTLAVERLIQPGLGGLPELFDGDWRPTAEAEVEPGHQFEWGFLLLRQEALASDAAAGAAGRRLIALAQGVGVDCDRGVALASLDQRLSPLDRTARLWPQTERTRAGALLAGTDPAAGWPIAAGGAASLPAYLDTPIPGLWHENMEADGAFRIEPSPASSLYHLVGAIQALDEACLKASS
jgi:mannose/cellobiose epimerase-like protein (N-acyl-D-glucosamine 2-epimerase family)